MTDAPAWGRRTARRAAMDLLARREHSPRELRTKLVGRGHAADEVDAALDALEREGLLSAARYLESFIASHARRGHGPLRIRTELERQGIARDEVSQALQAAGIDFAALAREVCQRRFGAAGPRDFADRARRLRFLQYRGFSADDARRAVGGAGDAGGAGDDAVDEAGGYADLPGAGDDAPDGFPDDP
jgi:regulatory protein